MNNLLKIDIVSDISCPWCIIGYRSLLMALDKMDPPVSVKIAWKPFQLNPNMPVEGQHLGEHLHEKYGSSEKDIVQTREMIAGRGAALGFEFNFKDDGRIYNTFNAHRLLYWAGKMGKQTELKLGLFGLYFTQGRNPSDVEQLLEVVEKIGLPVADARNILQSHQFTQEVETELAKYQGMGISSVPTFIINDKYKITGGQPVESFVDMLNDIAIKEA